ncbi:TraB domain-containing protein [Bienertia sinuspersici]
MATPSPCTLPPPLFSPTSKPNNVFSPPQPKPRPRPKPHSCKVSIKAPPPGFDYRSSQLYSLSYSAISEAHPELLDLVEMGCLVLIQKDQFGPVPPWRAEFVEPNEIWLVGTTHIDRASSLNVDRVVRALRPDNVVVELCRSRAGIMYTSSSSQPGTQLKSNMFSLSGAGFFGSVGRSINLAVFSSKISSDVDRPFGDEVFRTARIASEEIGAQIVLGDRPIEITLERAWNSLKLPEKLSLVGSVLRGITSSSDTSRDNESETDETSYRLYEKLSSAYPSLVQPLIHERDTYLAWSLKRSKAVNNCKRVVGVIGKGHLNGVIYALVSDQGDLRFRDVAGTKAGAGADVPNAWIIKVLKDLARDTVIGFLLLMFGQFWHAT